MFVSVYIPSFSCRNCKWIGGRFIFKCILQNENGSNFMGGERELRELIEELNAEKIVASGADKGIK